MTVKRPLVRPLLPADQYSFQNGGLIRHDAVDAQIEKFFHLSWFVYRPDMEL